MDWTEEAKNSDSVLKWAYAARDSHRNGRFSDYSILMGMIDYGINNFHHDHPELIENVKRLTQV